MVQKLRWHILLHYGLVPFRFIFGNPWKPFIFMIFAFRDVSMSPKTNDCQLWRHQITPNISRRNHFSIILTLEISKSWNSKNLKKLETMGPGKILQIRLIDSWNLEYKINVYQNTWNGNSVIWDQYLSKNMKWKFGNMGWVSIKKHEMEFW